ncbi:oryzin precursor [Durotheca rogersii]|uniref:oryzin precursor n=1 Tax=Durotheca rogersii TaxID=419775 RepID=UPI00221FB607|nr:oryzin precursor [Durotheca rogersii]KAI5864125.1 oryzin precursor [Durotheca rogersii]
MVGLRKLALLSTAVLGIAAANFCDPHKRDSPGVLTGRYIITLQDGLDASAVEQHMQRTVGLLGRDSPLDLRVDRQWNIGSWNAYSCRVNNHTLAQISNDDAVQFVEPDATVSLTRHVLQENATWGLGAISHRVSNSTDYVYDDRAGFGTYAYILDTGLLTTHQEFEGRAVLGHNAVEGEFVDDVGHGTHVAGTIGGHTYGVAKRATLISVKIFTSGVGRLSDFLEGYSWAVRNITEEKREAVSVINISAGMRAQDSVNRAVEEAYRSGVVTVVSAGNWDGDARYWSPASSPHAVTVGSIDEARSRSVFSNWGNSVDIFAPGEDVESAWIGSNTDTAVHSGTSMSAPHISGLILYLKSIIPYRVTTPEDTVRELQKLATSGVVLDPMGSTNLVGFNGNGVVIASDD